MERILEQRSARCYLLDMKTFHNGKVGPESPPLTPEEVKRAVKQEREWLNENNAVSAVNGGPVEDLEGVPLPADIHQGTPPLPHKQ